MKSKITYKTTTQLKNNMFNNKKLQSVLKIVGILIIALLLFPMLSGFVSDKVKEILPEEVVQVIEETEAGESDEDTEDVVAEEESEDTETSEDSEESEEATEDSEEVVDEETAQDDTTGDQPDDVLIGTDTAPDDDVANTDDQPADFPEQEIEVEYRVAEMQRVYDEYEEALGDTTWYLSDTEGRIVYVQTTLPNGTQLTCYDYFQDDTPMFCEYIGEGIPEDYDFIKVEATEASFNQKAASVVSTPLVEAATDTTNWQDNPNNCSNDQWIAAESPHYCIDKNGIIQEEVAAPIVQSAIRTSVVSDVVTTASTNIVIASENWVDPDCPEETIDMPIIHEPETPVVETPVVETPVDPTVEEPVVPTTPEEPTEPVTPEEPVDPIVELTQNFTDKASGLGFNIGPTPSESTGILVTATNSDGDSINCYETYCVLNEAPEPGTFLNVVTSYTIEEFLAL